MGLFSSEFKTTVATAVSRVLDDKHLPTTGKDALLQGILQDADIAETINGSRANNFAVRANNMYKYAVKSYTYGLPTGEIYSNTQGRVEILATIQQIEGSGATLVYHLIDSPNLLHMAWMKIVETQGYNPTTNELTALSNAKGFPVFLDDLVLAMPYQSYLDLPGVSMDKWGTPAVAGPSPSKPGLASGTAAQLFSHSDNEVDESLPGIHARLKFSWFGITKTPGYPDRVDKLISDSLDIALSGFDMGADYIHAKYKVGDATRYVLYLMGSGVYPSLDALAGKPQVVIGEFFPIIHFRHGKANLNVDKASDAYKSSKKLCGKLGMDFDQVVEGIASNPSIEAIEQAMLMLAVPANTSNQMELAYLFEFFSKLHAVSPEKFKSIPSRDLINLLDATKAIKESTTSFVISDALFSMSLRNQGIFKRTMPGAIGAVGFLTSNLDYAQHTVVVKGNGNDGPVGEDSTLLVKTPIHTYKKQVTPNTYEEVRILGLVATYYVQGEYHVTKGVAGDANLLIPLDSTITGVFQLKDRETLYARSLHYVINSLTVQETKWYQSDGFMLFVQFVAVVIQIYTGVPVSTIILQGAALYALSAILGPQVAAIIGIIYGGVTAIGNLAATTARSLAMIAKDLLTLVNCLVDTLKLVMSNKFASLAESIKVFEEEAKDSWKKLVTANGLLESSNSLSPFVVLGESPSDFYTRTIHSGNIGMLAINGVHTFVEDSLRLPTFSQTIGGYA